MVFSIQHHSTCSIQEMIGHSTCSIQELIGGKMLQFLLPFVGRQSEPRFASQAAQKQQVIVQAGLLQHDWVVAVIRCPYLVAIFVDDNCDPLGLAERTNVSCCPVCPRMAHVLEIVLPVPGSLSWSFHPTWIVPHLQANLLLQECHAIAVHSL